MKEFIHLLTHDQEVWTNWIYNICKSFNDFLDRIKVSFLQISGQFDLWFSTTAAASSETRLQTDWCIYLQRSQQTKLMLFK